METRPFPQKINDPLPWPFRLIGKPTCKPIYGCNFLRWLFHQPRYWQVTYKVEGDPELGS